MALENTHYSLEQLDSFFCGSGKKIFFDGIGGISMNSLAHIALMNGNTVVGYDRTPSSLTSALEKEGVKIWYDSDPSHVSDCDALVYTVAIPPDNPEYMEAERAGIPRVSRANYLGYLMTRYRIRIGVSGMHGKSTTTAILESIFVAAGLDPTVNCGAKMADTGTAHRVGKVRDYFLFEACEYTDSFLDFYPTTAIILNIDRDHPDYFKSLDQTINSFTRYANKSSTVVVNLSDANAMTAVRDYKGKTVTFSRSDPDAEYYATDISYNKGFASFTAKYKDLTLFKCKMNVLGKHIVTDAMAAVAASIENGLDPKDVAKGLKNFCGALRRMEYCGKTPNGAVVYTDYAHHPTEIQATLDTTNDMGFKHVICLFQPHTYSRTDELFDKFVDVFSKSNLHELILSPIYSAREINTYGVSSDKLGQKIRENGKKCTCFSSIDDIPDYLSKTTGKDDLVIVMGAGDIVSVLRMLNLKK